MSKKVKTPNSNNPEHYFTPGRQEYDYMCKLVSQIASGYAKKSPVSFEDLAAEARLGACASIKTYDSSKAKFVTHMYNFMNGYCKNE